MKAIFRPPTLDERFFGHTTFVNVPVSIAPENMPAPSTAPVDFIIPAPDLTLSKSTDQGASSKFEDFILNHRGKILAGAIIVAVGIGAGYWYHKKQKEKDNKVVTPAV